MRLGSVGFKRGRQARRPCAGLAIAGAGRQQLVRPAGRQACGRSESIVAARTNVPTPTPVQDHCQEEGGGACRWGELPVPPGPPTSSDAREQLRRPAHAACATAGAARTSSGRVWCSLSPAPWQQLWSCSAATSAAAGSTIRPPWLRVCSSAGCRACDCSTSRSSRLCSRSRGGLGHL